jgi:hypothetical protein
VHEARQSVDQYLRHDSAAICFLVVYRFFPRPVHNLPSVCGDLIVVLVLIGVQTSSRICTIALRSLSFFGPKRKRNRCWIVVQLLNSQRNQFKIIISSSPSRCIIASRSLFYRRRCAIGAQSLWNCCTIALHSFSNRCAIAPQLMRNHCAIAAQSLGNRFAMQSSRNRFAIDLKSFCNRFEIVLRSLCDQFAIDSQSFLIA